MARGTRSFMTRQALADEVARMPPEKNIFAEILDNQSLSTLPVVDFTMLWELVCIILECEVPPGQMLAPKLDLTPS